MKSQVLIAAVMVGAVGWGQPTRALSTPTTEVNGVTYGIGPARAVPLGNAQAHHVEWSRDGRSALILYREFPSEPNAFAKMVEAFMERVKAGWVVGVLNRASGQMVRHATEKGPLQRITAATFLGSSAYILTTTDNLSADLRSASQTLAVALQGRRPAFELTSGPALQVRFSVDEENGMLAVATASGTLQEGVRTELRIFNPMTGQWLVPSGWPKKNLLVGDLSWANGMGALGITATGILGQEALDVTYDVAKDVFLPSSEEVFQIAASRRAVNAADDPLLWVSSRIVKLAEGYTTSLRLHIRRTPASGPRTEYAHLDFGLGAIRPILAPTDDGLLFEQYGALLFSDILRLDSYKLRQPDPEATADAVSRAKQIGTAIVMWASDHDDRMPSPSEFPEALTPYARDMSIFQGFVYTNTFSHLSGPDEPAKTEMGYIRVRGGRAVVYMDSSVRFIPDS